MEQNHQLGVDVGGTTIKAAIVDLDSGKPAGVVSVAATPTAPTPEAVIAVIQEMAINLEWGGPIGCALPGIVDEGALRRAPNLAPSWADAGTIDTVVDQLGPGAELLNDADAAGLAELHYGPDRSHDGLTILLTFGTGIGSALLHGRNLIRNSELGELQGRYGTFEVVASARAITEEDLAPQEWAKRAQPYFTQIEDILNPSRWIVSGGLSSVFDHYFHRLDLRRPVRVAHLGENAGIVGAAIAVQADRG